METNEELIETKTDEVIETEADKEIETKTDGEYGVDQIQVLEGLEAVRKRPAMYIGSTSEKGLHHCVYEIVDNAIDEAMAGYCSHIKVIIEEGNKIKVEDNGRGIPVAIHPKTGKSGLETVLTVLHAGGKFGGGGYKVSGGLHGVGASCVNALAELLTATVKREGKIYQQIYKKGKPEGPITVIGECDVNDTGTTIEYTPDPTIFETVEYSYSTLAQRLRELAYLNKGVSIELIDDRKSVNDPMIKKLEAQLLEIKEDEEDTKAELTCKINEIRNNVTQKKEAFCFNDGVAAFVRYLNRNKVSIHPDVIYYEGTIEDMTLEVALQYTDGYLENIFTFANNIYTPEGGTHLQGFKNALTKVINEYARNKNLIKEKEDNFEGSSVREGLTAIVSMKLSDPQFEGQTKEKLNNNKARTVAENVTATHLEDYFDRNPAIAKIIVDNCNKAQKALIASRKTRDLAKRKSALEGNSLPGKLADCQEKDPKLSEIFIVEGDSAGGSAKQGRERRTQAILPLRGKIMNVEKTRLDKILNSEMIKNMITAFGAGIGDTFDIDKLRYHKIVIMTDADVDGAHIQTLLLTFFYRYMKELVERGYVYIACPPLYKIEGINNQNKKETVYTYDDTEQANALKSYKKVIDIQRYKGLGEMNADQLFETTMNPETRTLVQVDVEDEIAADATFSLLMGEVVEPRREFIEENAVYAEVDI